MRSHSGLAKKLGASGGEAEIPSGEQTAGIGLKGQVTENQTKDEKVREVFKKKMAKLTISNWPGKSKYCIDRNVVLFVNSPEDRVLAMMCERSRIKPGN
jgi:hypothetical protein